MWEAEPQVLISIVVIAALYVGASFATGRRPRARQEMAFGAAILLMLLTLTGPLDAYAKGYCFSAYIFQQMILVFMIPPLLLLGLPDWMARPVMTNRFVEPVMRRLTRPLLAFLTFAMF